MRLFAKNFAMHDFTLDQGRWVYDPKVVRLILQRAERITGRSFVMLWAEIRSNCAFFHSLSLEALGA